MGEVGIVYKVMPTGVEIDLDGMIETIRSDLPKEADLNLVEKKPIAFGLSALEVQVILDDRKGGADEVEAFLSGIEGVGSVEVVSQTLL